MNKLKIRKHSECPSKLAGLSENLESAELRGQEKWLILGGCTTTKSWDLCFPFSSSSFLICKIKS